MRLRELGRLWRTVRHLKPIQVAARAALAVPRIKLNDRSPAMALGTTCGKWERPAGRESSLVGPMELCFLSQTHSIEHRGWDNSDIDRLWRYNLHYFDDLNAIGSATRRENQRALLVRWITENPPTGGTGWEPYPLSLRIVNWIKWFLTGQVPEPVWLQSLALQARWLRRCIEWHLLGNHLFANAKALVFAGLYFEGREANDWLETGLRILDRQMLEQVLPDGGHFELSTMYHALALEDVLDLINIANTLATPESPIHRLLLTLRQCCPLMLHWLRCMSHPDGSFALFNDSAQGIAPSNSELEDYAARMGVVAPSPPAEGFTDLSNSGYVRAARGPAVALLDMAPIGPDYLVGHAHADTLTFELSLGTRRIIVNGGTSCYGLTPERLRQRGTARHSTVQIGALDSSEVWSGFRVGRRARIVTREVSRWRAKASHDGWRKLPGRPLHERSWSLEPDALIVEDVLSPLAPEQTNAVARFHLAPGLSLVSLNFEKWAIKEGSLLLAHVVVEVGEGSIMESQYAPQFGLVLTTEALVVKLHEGRAVTRWIWNSDAHLISD